MTTDSKSLTPQKILKLAAQLPPKHRFKVISELMSTLDTEQLEDLLAEVEQAIVTQTILEDTDPSEEPQARRKIEIKYINRKPYAYLRWRDRSEPDEYLGPAPLMPKQTYQLTHKKDGRTKVLKVLDFQILEDGQVDLLVQLIKPFGTTKSYRYPDCIKEVFSKKEWQIELLPEASDTKTPYPSTDSPVPVRRSDSEAPTPQGQPRSAVWVPRGFSAKVVQHLQQWAALSQVLSSTPQWNLVFYPNKAILLNQFDEVIVVYDRNQRTLATFVSVRALLTQLRETAWEVANARLAIQQQALARQLFTRLQSVPQQNSAELLAYLCDLPISEPTSGNLKTKI